MIGDKIRQEKRLSKDHVVVLVINFDEPQLAHDVAVEQGKKDFVKTMSEFITKHNQTNSNSRTLVLPIVTGTSPGGISYMLTQGRAVPLKMNPISVDSAK